MCPFQKGNYQVNYISTREFDLDMVFKLLDHKWSIGDER